MVVITVDKNNFQKEVLDYKGLVLVDFFATWCGPCKMTSPIIEELSGEMPTVKFIKVDVDANPELISQYEVFSIPTFVIFKDGQAINQFVGALGKDAFVVELNKATEKTA